MKSLKSECFLFLLSSFHSEIEILKMKSPFLFLFWNLYFANKNLQRQVILNLGSHVFHFSALHTHKNILQHHNWNILIQIQDMPILLYNLDLLNSIVLRLRNSCLFGYVPAIQAEVQNALPNALPRTVPEGNWRVDKCPGSVWGQTIHSC